MLLLLGFLLPGKLAEYRLERDGGRVFGVRLQSVRCASTDAISFYMNGRLQTRRAYLSATECSELQERSSIKLVTDDRGTYRFANPGYNDSAKNEVYAFGALGVGCILGLIVLLARALRRGKAPD